MTAAAEVSHDRLDATRCSASGILSEPPLHSARDNGMDHRAVRSVEPIATMVDLELSTGSADRSNLTLDARIRWTGRLYDASRGCLRRAVVLWTIVIAVIILALMPGSRLVAAEPAPLSEPIGPQALTSALTAFAMQSRLQIVYESKIAANVSSRGATAGLQPREALKSILAGTGINFEFVNERTIRLYVASPP